MAMKKTGIWLLGAFLVLGCASSPLRITDTGLQHTTYGYEVRFHDGDQFLPSDWRLDNFYGKDGRKPKTEDAYTTKLSIDADGDGNAERTESVPTFDLRFENLHSNGTIVIRSVLFDQHEQSKDLPLVVADIINSIAGGYDFRIKGRVTSGDVRFATRQVAAGPATVAGVDAYFTTVDVYNVDQSLIAAPAVVRRMKLVLIRSGLVRKLNYGAAEFPIYLVAQYVEHPKQFDANLPAFTQLLGQIQIGGNVGYKEAAPSSPEAEPPRAKEMPAKEPPAVPTESSTDTPS